jgi:hypothetical protein
MTAMIAVMNASAFNVENRSPQQVGVKMYHPNKYPQWCHDD